MTANSAPAEGWRSVLEAWLAQVATNPGACAIEHAGQAKLSYGQLYAAARDLAAVLEAQGVGREQVVALALPKGPELVVSWLAVWLAGGAFCTLDPSLPAARAQGILARLAPKLVLYARGGALTAGAPEVALADNAGASLDCVAPDCAALDLDLWFTRRPPPAENSIHGTYPRGNILPSDLAYVCWTSGSTGAPKGAEVEHRGLPYVIGAQVRRFELGPGARCLWYLRPGFDASLSDVLTCLAAGGTLCIEDDLAELTPRALLARLEQRKVSHIDLPPSLLKLLSPADCPESLRTVIIGGEAPDIDSVRQWSTRIRLVNVYGPTECTICTSMLVCTPDFGEPWLGEPNPGTEYALAEGSGVGAFWRLGEPREASTGELLIGGAQLGRGYFADGALTAERFFDAEGQRWYRTGDRVEFSRAGVRFLGRIDRQLKLHGQLVAPEDVEAALISTGLVRRACVALGSSGSGPCLLACVELSDTSERAASPEIETELRRRMALTLPGWMLPRGYIFAALPETSSGKVDLPALRPLIDAYLASLAGGYSGSQNCAPEAPLLAAVREQLGRVDPALSFYAQGGDSLGVIELLVRLDAAGVHCSAEMLTSSLSLAELCAGEPVQPTLTRQLEREAVSLAAELATYAPPAGQGPQREGGSCLISGATGFLGSRALLELLEREPSRRYIALVRARDPDHAWQRVRAACDRHSPRALQAHRARISCVVGDVEQAELGLNQAAYAALSLAVDAVIHAAADVNLVLPYAALRRTNLRGTAEIVRFCLRGRPKALHYASTLSVFSSTNRCPEEVLEDTGLDPLASVSGGYAQTKWAAERMLELLAESQPESQAQRHAESQTQSHAEPSAALGLQISVYRFGLLTGDSSTGYVPENDWLSAASRGLCELGIAPISSEADLFGFDLTPVDYAARAYAELVLRHRHHTPRALRRFHISGPRVSLGVWLSVLRQSGAELEEIPSAAFAQLAQAELRADTNPAAARARFAVPLLAATRLLSGRQLDSDVLDSHLLDSHLRDSRRGFDLFQATGVRFDTSRTARWLKGSGVNHPGAPNGLLLRYAERMRQRSTLAGLTRSSTEGAT